MDLVTLKLRNTVDTIWLDMAKEIQKISSKVRGDPTNHVGPH